MAGAFPFFRSVTFLKAERSAVDAVPEPRRLRAVWKHVAQVSRARRAPHLNPFHPQRSILNRLDCIRRHWVPETRPSAPRLKLLVRGKQGRIASPTMVDSVVVVIHQSPGKGGLRPALTHYMKLLRSQQLAPLGLRLVYLLISFGLRLRHGSSLPSDFIY